MPASDEIRRGEWLAGSLCTSTAPAGRCGGEMWVMARDVGRGLGRRLAHLSKTKLASFGFSRQCGCFFFNTKALYHSCLSSFSGGNRKKKGNKKCPTHPPTHPPKKEAPQMKGPCSDLLDMNWLEGCIRVSIRDWGDPQNEFPFISL